ncbi:MAG: DUF1622 domain-containing protein [Methanobacteriota archaeon]
MSYLMNETIKTGIETASQLIEILAVAIILGAVLAGTLRYMRTILVRGGDPDANYRTYKHGLGRSLLLGLEILVAADVIRTVALEQTLESIISLGMLVLVRTFLSWALVVEIEGRWPWQRAT